MHLPIESGERSPLRKLEREETIAERLGISARHLRELRSRQLIPFVRFGRSVRMDPEAVAQAVERLTVRVRSR